jgi:hypothetical protein
MMIREAPFTKATAGREGTEGVDHRHRAARIPCPFQEAAATFG